MSNINLGIITSSFLPAVGGVEISLHNLASNLIVNKINPIVFTSYTHAKKLKQYKIKLPYKVVSLPPKFFGTLEYSSNAFFSFSNFYLKKIIKKHKIKIFYGLFGYPVGVMLGNYVEKNFPNHIPSVCRCVGEDIQINKDINYGLRITKKVDRLIKTKLNQLDFLVASSNTITKEYNKLNIKSSKIKLIPNPVNINKFNKKKKLKSTFNFLCLGRYHKKKNFEFVIDVINSIDKGWVLDNKIVFYFVGTNISNLENYGKFKKQRFIKIIDTQINNKDFRNFPSQKIINYYKNSDCFLMPSTLESFGNVLTEAMASSLPIISLRSPGCIDVLDNGKFGQILKKNSPTELVYFIKRIVDDKFFRMNLVKKSKAGAKKYCVKSISKQFSTFFKKIANV